MFRLIQTRRIVASLRVADSESRDFGLQANYSLGLRIKQLCCLELGLYIITIRSTAGATDVCERVVRYGILCQEL